MPEYTAAVEGQAAAEGEATLRRTKSYEAPDARLQRYNIALTNAAATPEILTKISEFNYDAARLGEGKRLCDEAMAHMTGRAKEFGEQLEASANVRSTWDTAGTVYVTALRVARLALGGNTDAETSLVLRGPRGKNISRWLADATTFYTNLLATPRYLEAMAHYGYTEKKLREEAKLVQALAEADADHKQQMGEAQTATKARDAKFEELDDWMSKFYEIARISIADQQQWLEKLGMYQAS